MLRPRGGAGFLGGAAAAAGVVAAVALVGVGFLGNGQRASLAQVAVVGGKLVPDGGASMWDTAIGGEPQRLMKTHQVDFHRLPVGHCPEDTPGCAKSHQADHHIVLASDRRPRNYVYNYFTDEGDAAKDVTKDRMVQYIHPPKQALWDRAGNDRDGDTRYANKLGDNILDIPNDQGWQSGDIHLAMDGHDRMGFPHMYKSKRATTLLHKVQAKKPKAQSRFEKQQQLLHKTLHIHTVKADKDAHALFKKALSPVVGGKEAKAHKTPERLQTFVVSDSAKVLKGKAAKGAHRVHRKKYFGNSHDQAVADLDSYFDKLGKQENAKHIEALLGAHHLKHV